MAQRHSNPVRYYSVSPPAIATEPNSSMRPVATSTVHTITSPKKSQNQPQRTFILNHPPLGETERRCPHKDLTPIGGVSDIFRCDECRHKPELGWLWTCTQDVVREDGLIDPKKCALLEPTMYTAVMAGAFEEVDVKIMIKQRLAVLSREEITGFHTFQDEERYQGQRPKDEPSMPERQKYLRQNSLRVRFAEENSYRSPSPPVDRDDEEDKNVSAHQNTVQEQQNAASDEDDYAEYIAWLNMITNMRNETNFGQLRSLNVGLAHGPSPANGGFGSNAWVQSIQGVHAQQQQNHTVQTDGSQPQVIDRSYIARLRREMHSLDYHEAIADMHKTSRVSPQQLRARHQPEVSRSKSFRSHFQRSHHGQNRDNGNQIAAPVPVRPLSHDYSRQYQSPDHQLSPVTAGRQHANKQDQPTHYRGVQSPPEMHRGRSLTRSNSHPAREPQSHSIHRVPFVLNVHDPDDQNSTVQSVPVQVAARAIGYIRKQQLSPEYRTLSAVPEQPSYRTQRPLPPPPPRRPKFVFPCGYKICSTCKGAKENEMLPATRYNPEESAWRNASIPVHEPARQSDIQDQPMFFRPDFEDPSNNPIAKDGILMRDAQYFLARENDPELRGLIVSHSTILNLGESTPAPADENPASRMEGLAVEGSDNSTDDSVGAREQKVI